MKKRRKRKVVFYKNKRFLIYSLLSLFLFLGMGYSVLSTDLDISGDITLKEYYEPTLYNVLKKAVKVGTYAREYEGEHQDSMDPTKSTEKIYHWYGSNATNGTAIQDKFNVVFAGICWQMIRTTDTAIHTTGDTIRKRKVSDIRNRTATMDLYENCIYLSIHQNKYEDSRIWGTQTFYSANCDESREIAGLIQNAVKSQLQPKNKRQIKKSGTDIYVLYNATKPAVMVECGFVSNQSELNQLKDSTYQNNMALSIATGIINYNISEVKNGSEV